MTIYTWTYIELNNNKFINQARRVI